MSSKIQTKTAAERAQLVDSLEGIRASLAMVEGDINPAMGGRNLNDGGETLTRVRNSLKELNDILAGRLEVKA